MREARRTANTLTRGIMKKKSPKGGVNEQETCHGHLSQMFRRQSRRDKFKQTHDIVLGRGCLRVTWEDRIRLGFYWRSAYLKSSWHWARPPLRKSVFCSFDLDVRASLWISNTMTGCFIGFFLSSVTQLLTAQLWSGWSPWSDLCQWRARTRTKTRLKVSTSAHMDY